MIRMFMLLLYMSVVFWLSAYIIGPWAGAFLLLIPYACWHDTKGY